MKGKILLLAAAIVALLAGLWTGLIRVGWALPLPSPAQPVAHGPLMVCGFLGTVISLERAVALERRWSYAGPALVSLGTLSLLAGAPLTIVATLFTLGSAVLVAASLVVIRIHPLPYAAVMGLGAVTWLSGNVLWASGRPIHGLVLWWVAFPALTIAGERLQLSRIVAAGRLRQASFLVAVGLILTGATLSVASLDGAVADVAWRLSAAGLLALALWLLRYDIARRNVREPGLRRFMAACLLSGYAWLAFAGALGIGFAALASGPRYDAFLHAVFLGFVFAMIFAHAPIILPAIAGKAVPFHRTFYVHLILLNASLILRVAGDLSDWTWGRSWGGALNAVALLLFPAITARAVIAGNRAGSTASAG